MNFVDYVMYNFLNMRTPDLVEKMRTQEYATKIANQKYMFVDLKAKTLTETFAKYIFEIYKVVGPLINSLREEFVIKDGKQFSYYLIEVSFTNEVKELYATLNKDYMLSKIDTGVNPNTVFNEVKSNFVKFKKYVSGENAKETNLIFNILKDFSAIARFDFFLFLRAFCTSFVDGAYNSNPTFKPTSNVQVVDDLIKLDEAIQNIMVKKELVTALNTFCKYSGIPEIPEKNMKALLTRIKYLQTPGVLSNIIIFFLRDFTYKPHSSYSNVNIFVNYITDFTKNLKNDMDSIISNIKSNKISTIRNNIFSGIEILKLSNVNEDKNEQLQKFDCEYFTCVEPLQYIKTFVIEMFDMDHKDALNDMFVGLEFVSKERNSQGLDAFYTLSDSKEEIQMFDTMLSPETEACKKLMGWILTKNKANANRDLIDGLVKKIDEEGNKIVLSVYNALIDITTLLKGIVDDCATGSKVEISNPNKCATLQKFSVEKGRSILSIFEEFISLLKNFVR